MPDTCSHGNLVCEEKGLSIIPGSEYELAVTETTYRELP